MVPLNEVSSICGRRWQRKKKTNEEKTLYQIQKLNNEWLSKTGDEADKIQDKINDLVDKFKISSIKIIISTNNFYFIFMYSLFV